MNIPNERIKTCSVAVMSSLGEDQRFMESMLWDEMAREIASKLAEFGKFSTKTLPDGSILYSTYIDVIVPLSERKQAAA